MSIRSLKRRADILANDASHLRTERNRRAARCLATVRRRVASPVGLAVCFGVGVVAGSRANQRDSKESRPDGNGIANQVLSGPLGTAAVKLASAFIAASFMPPRPPGSSVK